tara:strand:- start:54 stop:527 length:474 start_codon:yes stop_codon:yes gene_type:complete
MALPAAAAVARFIASSGIPAAIKKYGVKAVNEAKKHIKDLKTPKKEQQKRTEKATKNQRTYREGQRKSGVVGSGLTLAGTLGTQKLLEKENEGKGTARGTRKAASKPSGGRTNPSDYPTYKRNTESAKSFRAAQRAAKAKGNKTFTWEGRRYNTTEK